MVSFLLKRKGAAAEIVGCWFGILCVGHANKKGGDEEYANFFHVGKLMLVNI